MRRLRYFWAVGLAVTLLAIAARAADAPPAPAADTPTASDIGRSILVVNDVDGQAGDTPAKRIVVNDDIVFQEDITTGTDAKAVIEFRDGSTFEIGPNTAVRIDSFVFNPEESTSHKALQVTHGVFRYVSAYVSSDQETKIITAAGQMGIRGSVATGIVDPSVPDFIFLGEGNATFTNSAGSSTLQAGNAIAVPSSSTQPMSPDAMPAPVAAQALQAIDRRLPPQTAVANRPAADDAWLKHSGAADLVPATEQQRLATAAAGTARPLPTATGSGALAGELGLLTEANRINLFDGRQSTRTAEQTAFLARAARDNPNAGAMMRRYTDNARALHAANMRAGTEFVMRGIGHAAPSAEVMRRVTAASVRANPGAAAMIQRHATESYRGPDRGELNRPNRPGNERRPEERRPEERRQEERRPPERRPEERRQEERRPAERRPEKAPPRAQQPRPQRPPPKAPAPRREPPKKNEDRR
jgi:hypothetical protein